MIQETTCSFITNDKKKPRKPEITAAIPQKRDRFSMPSLLSVSGFDDGRIYRVKIKLIK